MIKHTLGVTASCVAATVGLSLCNGWNNEQENKQNSPIDVVVSSETALVCLFRLGAQNGVYAEIGAVRRRNLIEGDSLPVARLVELAGEFGLRAERVQLDWDALRSTPFSHPLLLPLTNNNAVGLVGVQRNGPEEVAWPAGCSTRFSISSRSSSTCRFCCSNRGSSP